MQLARLFCESRKGSKRLGFGLTAAMGLLLLSGCIQSVYPWYAEQDVVFDPSLAGTWLTEGENDDGKECMVTITADETREVRHYNLEIASATCPDANSNVSAGAQLFQVGGNRYLDIWDDTHDLNTLMKVRQEGDGLLLIPLDIDSLELLMKKGRFKLRARVNGHTMAPDDIMITSETGELRRFLRENSNQERLFNEGNEFRFRRR